MKFPPLHSLRAFEGVARLGSVTAAADELCVTHSAISHQLKNLEDWLEIPLVEKHGRGIRLTEAGERYRTSVCEAFHRISMETELLRRRHHNIHIRVSSLPMFAASWLMTQMHKFWAMHPEVQVALHYSRGTMAIDPDETDVAIRFGRPGDFPGFLAMPLLEGSAVAVASPEYLKRMQYTNLSDLRHLSLLHDENRDFWSLWLNRAGKDAKLAEAGIILPDGNMTLAATMAGEGVGLLRRAVIAAQLRSGSLVALSDVTIEDHLHYLVLTPATRPVQSNALIFVRWLQSLPGTLRLGVPTR